MKWLLIKTNGQVVYTAWIHWTEVYPFSGGIEQGAMRFLHTSAIDMQFKMCELPSHVEALPLVLVLGRQREVDL